MYGMAGKAAERRPAKISAAGRGPKICRARKTQPNGHTTAEIAMDMALALTGIDAPDSSVTSAVMPCQAAG